MNAAHPAGVVRVRKGPFEILAPPSKQPLAASPANPPTIRVDGGPGCRLAAPAPPAALRFRDVAAETDRLEIFQSLVAVIALVADKFLWTAAHDGFQLFGRTDQRRLHR